MICQTIQNEKVHLQVAIPKKEKNYAENTDNVNITWWIYHGDKYITEHLKTFRLFK